MRYNYIQYLKNAALKSFRALLVFGLLLPAFSSMAQAPTQNFTLCGFGPGQGCPNTVYSNSYMNSNNEEARIEYDNFVSAYHASMARQEDGSVLVWGENMANNGSGHNLSPLVVNSTNYPALTGQAYKFGIGSNGSTAGQAIVLASNGLYAWGNEGIVLDNAITSSSTFQKLTINGQTNGLPVGVTPADVKMMFVTWQTIAITTCSGDVWVISLDGNNRGNGNTGNSTTWYRVTTSSGGNPFLTNIIACRGAGDALMALDASGNIWTWEIIHT